MKTDRRTILHLVALGRINAAEAERLLIAWDEGREIAWAIAASLAAFTFSQIHFHELLPGLEHAVRALPISGSHFFHHASAVVTYLFGGII